MSSQNRTGPTFWTTVRLLLATSRARFTSRQTRQQQLLNNRSGKNAADWGALGLIFGTLLMLAVHGLAAASLAIAVDAGESLDVHPEHGIRVSHLFLMEAETAEPASGPETQRRRDAFLHSISAEEAARIAIKTGRNRDRIQTQLFDSLERHGTSDFTEGGSFFSPSFAAPESAGPIASLVGSVILLMWLIMMTLQGEGLELDLQRQRHPMWEWLFSHPVPPGAVFLAEMISPLAANPIYWGGPLFSGILYGMVYGPALGILAALLVGVPVTISVACFGKALEVVTVLRLAPRTRGAVIGIMSWLGYATMMLFFLGFAVLPTLIPALARPLSFISKIPSPWLGLFLGQTHTSWSFLLGVFTCLMGSLLTLAAAVWLSVWATRQGLTGSFAANSVRRSSDSPHFGKEPLYRKEFLWFIRDRSAIVQTILVPVTLAATQAFNLRGLLVHAQHQWNYLCGVAIFFGTYFLWVLGPKSLSSEGSALWIALTWPRGLESLLKAKAWLWSLISTGLVSIILCYSAFLFPSDLLRVLLVGVGWFLFARSMAEKSVTLVTITSESGEQQPVPKGRRWAAQLGMLTFAVGVLTLQWHIALMGIVYSTITAAAMWQNFRARLPYLYDPWSEKIPPPPTLMHAMISISILVEAGAVVTGVIVAIAGASNIAIAQAIAYAICAVFVSIGIANFLGNRGVTLHNVWCWTSTPSVPDDEDSQPPWWSVFGQLDRTLFLGLLAGAGAGILLGGFAHGYLAVLRHLPATAEIMRKSQEQMAKIPNLRISFAVMAIVFAPFAEEYLFRGLLFRALDREWGGWQAVVGSAAFFAIYHPALSWLPVFLVGVTNALLFKKSGRLMPAVILHMVYNAVVTM